MESYSYKKFKSTYDLARSVLDSDSDTPRYVSLGLLALSIKFLCQCLLERYSKQYKPEYSISTLTYMLKEVREMSALTSFQIIVDNAALLDAWCNQYLGSSEEGLVGSYPGIIFLVREAVMTLNQYAKE